MWVVVAGGAGFVGGQLAETFARTGYDVVTVEDFDPYYTVASKEYNVNCGRNATEENKVSYEPYS